KYLLSKSKIIGGEALVRWEHSEKGIIFPDEFIPLFEKNGNIIRLDMYMLEKACQWLSYRLKNNLEYVPLSVNQSRISLYKEGHVDDLKSMVEKYGVPTELIEIEITENIFLENFKHIEQILLKLHNYGFKVSMDDFGSGNSSLNMLHEIFVDVIKLDKKFFDLKDNKDRGHLIIKNIVSMTADLDIGIIAEGVELKEHVDFLISIGCNQAQGYYFSKPVTVNKFEEIFEENLINGQLDG
ncbi:MAG: EAL domain-containing protein, partial [Proteocatella sp.]